METNRNEPLTERQLNDASDDARRLAARDMPATARTIRALLAEVTRLRNELAEAKRDTARLDWLESQKIIYACKFWSRSPVGMTMWRVDNGTPLERVFENAFLRAAIDDAIAKEPK